MFTEGTQTILTILCVIIIVFGLIGGIFVGQALRTPEVTLDYDSEYLDDVVELKWSSASVIGMLATWFSSIILAFIVNALSVCLKSLDMLHRSFYELRKSQNKEERPQTKLFKDTEA